MDKLLAEKIFSYPIYRADTEYRYRKIGTPTVFAELLMGLAHNDFPQLANNNNSLAKIARVLKLDFTFVRYTLENLNDTGLIEHIDLPDTEDDLAKLSLADLKLTDNGKKFYHEKKMPGRRRTEYAEFWFNPLLNEYVGKPKQSASNVEVVELDCSFFPVDKGLLLELSGQESANQKWSDAETELEHDGISVTCDEDTFLPQTVPIKLTLDGNRYLNIDSSDKLFSQWINTRDPQVIKEHLLKPMISNAKNALQGEAFLYYPENDLLSLVLADQESDIRQIGDAVEVKFNGNQEIDDKMPLIVFADIAEAKLDGKHLSIPALLKDSDGLTRIFFRFSDNTLFVEETGCLKCYFDHQPYLLPAKVLYQKSENWLADLPALSQPNMAVLAFMANFVPAADILKKLPEMTITQASDFAELIKKTWNKPFKPEGWAEMIKPLNNEDDLRQFTECFPKVELGLARLSAEAQRQAFDWAVNNEKSTVHKIPELSELLALHKALGRLNPTALELKDIKPNSLEKISLWQKNVEKIDHTFPAISASNGIAKLSEQLKQWQTAVFRLFEPLDETRKFAVLDTNFVRNRPGRLSAIQTEGTVILPQTVLNELDSQKEKFKRDLATAKQTLVEKTEQCEAIVSVDIDAQIADCDARLGRLKAELDAVRTQLTQLNDKEKPNG